MQARAKIIILNHNGVHFLEECLNAALHQDYPDYDIILVDNHSFDNSLEFVNDLYHKEISSGKLQIIANFANFGFSGGNNVAINEVLTNGNCKYIITLNNDTVVKSAFVTNLVQCAEKHKKAGSVMSKMLLYNNPSVIDSTGLLYSRTGLPFSRGKLKPSDKYNTEKEIFGACAGACLYRVEALKSISYAGKFFDEDFFAYCEDVDLALRLKNNGWECWYCPDATVLHHGNGTQGEKSDFVTYHSARNNTWVLYKNLPLSFIILNLPLLWLGGTMQVLFNIIFRGSFAALRGKWDAYKNLKKMLKKRNERRYPGNSVSPYIS